MTGLSRVSTASFTPASLIFLKRLMKLERKRRNKEMQDMEMGKLTCRECGKSFEGLHHYRDLTGRGICPGCFIKLTGLTPSMSEPETPKHLQMLSGILHGF
jgi:hypothetical protein